MTWMREGVRMGACYLIKSLVKTNELVNVVVCLRGLYHHILLATARALCQGQCTPHARFPLTKGGGLISGSPLLGRTGGVVELVLGSVFIIELDTGLAGIYFHRYYTEYDVCHKQNT